MRPLLAVVLCLVAGGCREATEPRPAADTLVVTRQSLHPTPGLTHSLAHGVNDAGVVVGLSYGDLARIWRATRWENGGPGIDLGPPGDSITGPTTRAHAVNQAGLIIGYFSIQRDDYHATRWGSGAVDTLGAGVGHGVNNRGQVVGCYIRPDVRKWRALLWEADGSVQELGTLGGPSSCALAINDSGWVAGWASNVEGHDRAFLWKPGEGMRDLGALNVMSRAYGLNNHGEVVGMSEDGGAGGFELPFLWTAELGMVKLPLLPMEESREGTGAGAAYAINDAGWIVGYSMIGRGLYPGFENATLWRSRTSRPLNLTDLSKPGYGPSTVARAFAISPAGVIAGWESLHNITLPVATVWRVQSNP